MNQKKTTLTLLAFSLFGAVSPALAITYTTINYPGPGTLGTDPNGVTEGYKGISGGNIVGNYNDSSKVSHGFLYNGSTYTPIDDPFVGPVGAGPVYTYANGISGSNIVGTYYDNSIFPHAFLYNGSSYTTLADPLAKGGDTDAEGISGNNIVGNYTDSSFNIHGFSYDGSTWTTLDDPMGNATYAFGISGGNIVGAYFDASNTAHGFLYNGTKWTTLDDPLAGPGPDGGTLPLGISGGNIVGEYVDSSEIVHGFLYDGSTYTTLADPLGTWSDSVAAGIDGNLIIGGYHDSAGNPHGFEATVPEPSTLALAALAGLGLVRRPQRRTPAASSADSPYGPRKKSALLETFPGGCRMYVQINSRPTGPVACDATPCGILFEYL